MNLISVKYVTWDKVHYFKQVDFSLKVGDKVVVETDFGDEMGEVVDLGEVSDSILSQGQDLKVSGGIFKKIIRKANPIDLERVASKTEKDEAMKYCSGLVSKYKLEMKLVDVYFSFSGTRITFAFIADGRVDFRELVKDLTNHFNKTVRLTQIGTRDEVRICGDCGHCGKELCCKKFIKDFSSITSDMAETQQVSHRGSDRISGVCGRLMCCLSYEQYGYKELIAKMPNIGQKVDVDGKKGVVINVHVIKQTVDVEFISSAGERKIQEVSLNRNKK